MRRFLCVVAAVLGLSCQPGDTETWVRTFEQHPHLAMRHLRVHHPRMWARAHPPRWRPDTACSQWAQTALDAGWTRSQWYEPVARIMWAESWCNPNAYNGRSGVAGLLQIHPLWRADPECDVDLYDPYLNLRCALHVYHVQGWSAWVTY
jgi:Lysozyme like domain